MRSSVAICSVATAVALLSITNQASASSRFDLCSAPTMKTEKWHSLSEIGGMTILMPPGFVAGGVWIGASIPDAHGYVSGSHRFILVGSGAGPSNLNVRGAVLTQTADCETVLNGRRAELTTYMWNEEDNSMSPTGQAGPQYMAVARFFSTGSQREVFAAFKSNIQSDIGANRQMFWTITFPGYAGGATSAAQQTVASSLIAAAPGGVAAAPPVAAPPCVPKPDPTLPAASAVVDSALVQMLISGAPAMPHGFALMSLKFDGSSLAGLSVAQSDLPDPVQKQLVTLVASNLKPHDAKSPPAYMLRVDTQDQGLHYTVQGSCAP
jgi:hypothetical protein